MPRRSKVIGAATLSHKGEVTCAASVTLLADAADHPSEAPQINHRRDCPAPSLARLPGSEPGEAQSTSGTTLRGRARLDEAKGLRVVTRSDACFPFRVRAERSRCTVPRRRSSLCFMTPAQHCLPAAFGDPCETSPSRGTPWSPCI